MTKKELKALLLRETGRDVIQPGWNYTVLSIRTKAPWNFRDRLCEVRQKVEEEAGVKFLPFVCLCRSRSVLVPVPLDAKLNLVSEAIAKHVKSVDFQVPVWG